MGSGRKKKNTTTDIPSKLTSSLTDEMRSSLGTEEFENTQSNASTSKSLTMSVTQRTSQKGSNLKSKDSTGPKVTIMPYEAPIEYQNSCLSIFEGTVATVSLDSLQSINSDLKKKLDANPPLKSEEQQEVHTLIEHFTASNHGYNMGIPKAVNDYQFMEGTRADGANAFIAGEKHRQYRFAQEEHNIINTMISDVNRMIQDSGRTNVSITFKVEKGNNGIPSLSISLIPCYYPQPDQEHMAARNQVTMVKQALEEKRRREQHRSAEDRQTPVKRRRQFEQNFYEGLCRINKILEFLTRIGLPRHLT